MLRKDCKCDCHMDGRIRHTKDDICCEKPDIIAYSMPCKHPEHPACLIEPEAMIGQARITDVISSYPSMVELQKYTGCVTFSFDPNTKSLDIRFKRGEVEWDYGAGIQINELTDDDKQALIEYLAGGE